MATIYNAADSVISQGFGPSQYYYGQYGITRNRGYFHDGDDLAGPAGTAFYAPENGSVMQQKEYNADGSLGGLGNFVVFTGDSGHVVLLGHLSRFGSNGRVNRGAAIGFRGTTGNSTGNHFHVTVYPPNRDRNNGVKGAIPPNDYFSKIGASSMPVSTKDHIDEVYKGFFGPYRAGKPTWGADADALEKRQGQNRVQIINDLAGSPEYGEILRREVHKRTGTYPPDSLIEANRKNQTPIPTFLVDFMTDRYGEAKAANPGGDAVAKLGQAKTISAEAADKIKSL